MAIGYIFSPYEDELFYSYLSRLCHANSMDMPYKFMEIVFDGHKSPGNPQYPNRLGTFIKSIEGLDWTLDKLIEKTTFLPLVKPFVDDGVYADALDSTINIRKTGSIYFRFHSENLFLEDRYAIKVCPLCFSEDIEVLGEAYIHRRHNVVGIKTCHKHGCYLDVIDYNKDVFTLFWDVNDQYKPNEVKYPKDDLKAVYDDLNHDIGLVLDGAIKNMNLDKVIHKINIRFKGLGVFVPKNTKSHPILLSFQNHFSDAVIDEFNLRYSLDDRRIWIRDITSKRVDINPIKQLIFIRYLFGGIEGLMSAKEEYRPFGEPPYPCLNVICPKYKEDVILNYEESLAFERDGIVGAFKCDTCGFTYTRSSNSDKVNDRYHRTQVKDRGELWYKELEREIREGKRGVTELNEIFSANIVVHAEKMGLRHLVKSELTIKKKPVEKKVDIEVYKKDILDFIDANPDATRSEIRTACRRQVSTIQKVENDWLVSVLPEPAFRQKGPNHRTKEEWASLDEELSVKAEEFALAILKSNESKRISIDTIEKVLKYSRLRSSVNGGYLPKMQAVLDKYVETRTEFLQRTK